MNFVDWILAAAFTGLMTFAFWLVLPDYGWAIGIALGGYLIYRAKRKRDRLMKEQQEGSNPPDPDQKI